MRSRSCSIAAFVLGGALLAGCSQGTGGPADAQAASPGGSSAVPEVHHAVAAAAERQGAWGSLKGHFVYDGTAPVPDVIVPTTNQAECGKHQLVKEELVVGKNGELANVVVWLLTKGVTPPEEAAKAPTGAAVLDNLDCHFIPHILVMRTGQPLEIKNSDPIPHNTKGSPLSNLEFNPLIPPHTSQMVNNLVVTERLPFNVTCSIHNWMSGRIVLRDDPYVGVSGPDGGFEIKDLPAGQELEFQVWQEKSGFVNDVTVDGAKKHWKFGRFKMTLKPGDNDLGTIKVAAAVFNK